MTTIEAGSGAHRITEKKGGRRFLAAVLLLILVSICLIAPPGALGEAPWKPADALKTYLLDNYPWEEIEVSNILMTGDMKEQPPVKIIVEKGPIGSSVFTFVFKDKTRNIVRANVRAFGWVVMTRRAYQRRHTIGDSDIYRAKMDVRKMPRSAIRDPQKVLGKSLKRSVAANLPLVEGMIENSQVVSRGKLVVLLISNEGMSVRAAGKTKEKGYVGMPVTAINLSSKKEVSGILVDESTVKVEL
ncbi:MAG: flagellar basal body P-ring formation protein FlgA [Nitrospiraceae bacterium]|nr:MAG: flagellar basal body P-ring formation protein FlgA [Nitrospiraceae bacterium]